MRVGARRCEGPHAPACSEAVRIDRNAWIARTCGGRGEGTLGSVDPKVDGAEDGRETWACDMTPQVRQSSACAPGRAGIGPA